MIRQHRAALSAEWAAEASATICGKIGRLEEFAAARTVGVYLALPGEVDLEPLIRQCREIGRRVCVPVFNAAHGVCVMTEWRPDQRLIPGKWGVPEPAGCDFEPCREIDLIAVPGVAFDPQGWRLGRGGGWYDRMLLGCQAVRIGVAFEFQIFRRLATEEHDMPVDLVITEDDIYRPDVNVV